MVKLVFCLRRRDGLTREQFQAYWRDHHAPLVARHAAALGIRKYVQVHTLPEQRNEPLRSTRGGPPSYDGVAELWYDSFDAIRAAFATPAGQTAAQQLLDDERNFIDLTKSPLFFAEEHPIVGVTS